MKHQSYSEPEFNWLENFPKEFRSAIISNDREFSKSKRRSARQYPQNITDTNNNANLLTANRTYANHQHIDRRGGHNATFPNAQCRRSRKHAEEKSILGLSPLREHYADDSFEGLKKKYSSNNTLAPMQIEGLEYNVLIGDNYMIIGCVERSIEQWLRINDRKILEMDGKAGLKFWQEHKDILLKSCKLHLKKVREQVAFNNY